MYTIKALKPNEAYPGKKLFKVTMKAKSVEEGFSILKAAYPDVEMELVYGYVEQPPKQLQLFNENKL